MQRMGSVPFLCVNVNFTIDTMLTFDRKCKTLTLRIDAQCKRTFKPCSHLTFVFTSTSKYNIVLMVTEIPLQRMGSDLRLRH